MRASVLFFGVCMGLLDASVARAGAWLFPQGHGQVILATTFAEARKAFDATGRLVTTPAYRKIQTEAYLEHSLTDWLAVVAQDSAMQFHGAASPTEYLDLLISEAMAGLPLSIRGPPGAQYQGLGLGALGARLRLFTHGDYVFSAEATMRAASSNARRFLDMRDATQIDARLLMGRAFRFLGVAGFADTQIGYRSRGQNGDELRTDVTLGLQPLARLTLMAQSFSALAPRGAPRLAQQKLQASAVVEAAPSVFVQVGVTAALSGANSPAERGIVGAVWWRY